MPKLPIEDRKRMKSYLRYGDISTIAKSLGCSRPYIYQWFAGDNNSRRVEEAVTFMARARKQNTQEYLAQKLKESTPKT